MNANEARKLTEDSKEFKELLEHVLEEIRKKAIEGRGECFVVGKTRLEKAIIVKLEELGYKVEQGDNADRISWFEKKKDISDFDMSLIPEPRNLTGPEKNGIPVCPVCEQLICQCLPGGSIM